MASVSAGWLIDAVGLEMSKIVLNERYLHSWNVLPAEAAVIQNFRMSCDATS
jgi:hypothetical protein